jgi:hypothetical protein
VRFQPTVFPLALLLIALIVITFQPAAVAGSQGSSPTRADALIAQAIPPGQSPFPPPFPPPNRPSPEDEARARMQRELAKKANQEREAQLKRDTEQLLKLAKELKQYVDKTNADILSVDVVRKADEIEKLAHSVKEKMKNN